MLEKEEVKRFMSCFFYVSSILKQVVYVLIQKEANKKHHDYQINLSNLASKCNIVITEKDEDLKNPLKKEREDNAEKDTHHDSSRGEVNCPVNVHATENRKLDKNIRNKTK